MRLHDLTLTAFGPFADTQHVDVDAFADSGLFLLHGATGAGKSSILDGVCFALYGVVPGQRGRNARLRSDHAEPTLRTGVTLELTLRGRRFRVTREPAWERAKQRGSGTTTAPARTLLEERVGGAWTVLTTRNDEAGHLLREALGMSAEQFCQVVLLPQGEFASFLRAAPEERRPLLEQLFDTRRFSRVEQWFAERRVAARRSLEEAEIRRNAVVARLRQVLGDEELPLEVAGAQLDALCAAADADAQRLAEECARAEQALRAAQDAERAVAELADRQGRYARLSARADELAAAAPGVDEDRRRLAAGQRAAALRPLLRIRDEAVTSHARSLRARDAALAAVPAAVVAAVPADAAAPWEPEPLRQRHDECAVLEAALGREERLDRLRAEAAEISAALAAATTDSVRLDAAREAALDAAAVAGQRLTDARKLAADAGAAQARYEQVAVRAAAANRRDALLPQVTVARERRRAAVDTAQTARTDWLDLREARLEGMVAELAQQLVAGQGCPVCGSAEHPAPAGSGAGAIDMSDERAAQQRHEDAQTAVALADQELAVLERQLAVAESEVGDDSPAALLADELTAAEAELAAARQAAALVGDLEQQAAARAHEHDVWVQQVQALRIRTAELAATGERLAVEIAERVAELADARGDDPSVAARLRRVRRELSALQAVASAEEQLRAAAEAVARARQALAVAATDAGFPDVAAASAALLEPRESDGLARRIAAHDADTAAVAQQRTEPHLREAMAHPPADLAPAREACEAATATAKQATERAHVAERIAAQVASLADDLRAVHDELAPLQEDFARVDALSRLVEGTSADNVKRMRLSAYVLAARLEQVAAAASERLGRMSAGRYALVHTDDGPTARGRSGLGLRVLDAWTGLERETTSLSGGESFMASLSLALGLADVVTAEAAGAPIETLFVDEGFGSLDEDTLDEVMTVLDDLRSGGRTVGIVSHVAELRQRIPAQLRVSKGRSGSSVSIAAS